MPTQRKVLLAGLVGAVLAIGLLVMVVPSLSDPDENLAKTARECIKGPKNPEDAKKLKQSFDESLKNFLIKHGALSTEKLHGRLNSLLPTTAFEAHVVELPRGLRLVEIDTVLQASAALIMKSASEYKYFPVNGFEVFDDARLLSDQAGPVLVLIGHSGGQPPHRPIVKAYALLPDDLVDESDKAVPLIKGEGVAKFSKNNQDINIELSLPSLANTDNIALKMPVSQDATVRQRLIWKDARYTSKLELPPTTNAFMVAFARSLRHPELAAVHAAELGPEAVRLIKAHAGPGIPQVDLAMVSPGIYKVMIPGKSMLLELKPGTGRSNFLINKATVENSNTKLAAIPVQQEIVPVAAKPGHPHQAASGGKITIVPPTKTLATSAKPGLETIASPQMSSTKQVVLPTAKKEPGPAKTLISSLPGPASAPSWSQALDEKKEPAKLPVKAITKPEIKPELKPSSKVSTNSKAPTNVETKRESAKKESAQIASYLNATSVRLRSGPGLKTNAIDEIPRGAKVEILGQENGWYKVRYSGKQGFVYGGLVEHKKPSAYTTAVVTKALTVRDQNRQAMATPQVGDRLVIVSGIRNNKYKVQLSDGRVGYIDKGAIDVKVETPELVP